MNLSQYQVLLDQITNGGGTENTVSNENDTVYIPKNNELITFVVVNKTIQTPIALDDIIVQGDKNSRKIHFVIHRYYDGVDLSEKELFLNYINADLKTGFDKIIDVSLSDNYIEFDWIINSELTVSSGEITIQIEFCEMDEVGDVIYRFQTIPCNLKVEKTVIVNGDAEPNDYYLDIKFLNENTDPIVYEDMKSTAVPIEIKDRIIIMPSLEDVAVTQDSRSKLLTFKIKRYIDNVDLSLKTPCIKFKLLDGTGDRSFVCNKSTTDTTLQFDWLLDSKITSQVGKVEFAIEFIGYNEVGEFYCYNTLPSYIFISKGLDVDNIIEQPSASWMQSWNIMAENYLKQYIKYVKMVEQSVEQAMLSASEALISMQKAKLSEISAENDAGIAWQQADRAERMANLSAGYSQNVNNVMVEFLDNYSKFYSEYTNIRKKDEAIEYSDLSEGLQTQLNEKSNIDHIHKAEEIITDDNLQFISKAEKEQIKSARNKNTPITEDDLDANVAEKLNRVITGGGNGESGTGTTISGAQIDDITPSYSKVYSSKTTENKIASHVQNAISGIEGLSSNDFTNAEKQKLARIDDNANYFTLTTISASIVDETVNRRFTSPAEKEEYLDKYTKAEVDNMFSKVTSGMVWKPDVVSFADIAKTYPAPIKDWAVSTSNGDTYLYDGEAWIKIGSGKTPLATKNDNGLMSAGDKTKIDGVAPNANNYTHPSSHSATMINPTSERQFVTSAQKQAIDNISTSIENYLKSYRKNSIKILESDMDLDFLEKLSKAGGTIISDTVTSYAQTYSSAKIDSNISNAVNVVTKRIDDILADVATITDIDRLFV